jgi:dUTP pyrophosphatase
MKMFSDGVKGFAQRASHLITDIEATLSGYLFEKDKREEKIKQLGHLIESFTRDSVQKFLHSPVKVKVRTLDNFNGDLPSYETEGASGFDVRAQLTEAITLKSGERELIPTGLSFEIPKGYEIQVRPRSGLAIKKGLSMVNTPGTIDADYRGEVKVIVINHGKDDITINDQERISQFVVCPVVQAEFIANDDLSNTERGEGGFGSTGI